MFKFFSFSLPAAVARALLALLLLALCLPAGAQVPAWQSARAVAVATTAVTSDYSMVTATAVDAAGNVYLAGTFSNTVVVVGNTTLTSLGQRDVFVAKFNPASNEFVSAQRAGGTETDEASALALSGTGYDLAAALAVSGTSVYVSGSFSSPTAAFGPVTLTNAGARGSTDAFVAKLTDAGATGGFVWAQRAGGTSPDGGTALAVSGTSVYVSGYFSSPAAEFGTTTLSKLGLSSAIGFLAALTDPTITATKAAGPRVPGALFPNPARHTATLRLPARAALAPLVLTDALGRTVRHYPAPVGSETTLDLRDLPAGIYLLRGAGPALRLMVE
jgi:hypothetical protein